MADFSGVSEAIQTLMGGGARAEELAYRKETDRLTRQRRARALMDQAVANAVKSQEVAQSYKNVRGSGEAGPSEIDLILGGLGSSYAGTQRGASEKAKRDIQDIMLEKYQAGELDPDMLNALSAIMTGTKLAPTNVQVSEQAGAKVSADEGSAAQRQAAALLNTARAEQLVPAQAASAQAAAEQHTAAAELSRHKATLPSRGAGGGTDWLPGATTLAELFPPKAGKPSGELQEFIKWQHEQAQVDPSYGQFEVAYPAWLSGATAMAPSEPVVADAAPVAEEPAVQAAIDAVTQGAPAQVTTPTADVPKQQERPANYGNMADANAVIQGAVRARNAGKSRAQVIEIMGAELLRIGVDPEVVKQIQASVP